MDSLLLPSMSILPGSQFSLVSSPPPSDVAFGGEMLDSRPPQTYDHHSNIPIPNLRTENHQLWARQHPITPSFPGIRYPQKPNQAYCDADVHASDQVIEIQTPYNLGSWNPSGMQQVGEVPSTMTSPPMADKRRGDHIIPAPYFAHDPSQNATYWPNHAGLGSPRPLWPTLDQQPLVPLIEQEIKGNHRHHLPNQSIAGPSPTCSSYMTRSHHLDFSKDKYGTEPNLPHNSPYQPVNSTSPYYGPCPTLNDFLEADPNFPLSFYRVPRQNYTGSSHRKRAARAIEYDRLWIDEEEVLRGLMDPDGKLNVHQCRWDEDDTPCYLWIRGDKSSINAHIQKWHGGKPGGDKLRADCHWSACGKTMLKESIARHIVSIHLGEMWKCQGCGKEIARNDAYGRHAGKSNLELCRNAGALVSYSVDVQEINARIALDRGGRLQYASA